MHSGKLNSTQLNSSVQFSFPLCIEPATIRDDSATKLAVVAGSSQSGHTLGQSMQCLSLDENRRRVATTGDGRRRFLTVKNLRRPSPVVAGSVHSGRLNWTQLNWTKTTSCENIWCACPKMDWRRNDGEIGTAAAAGGREWKSPMQRGLRSI